MSISSEDFRDALRHFPSGVTIVTINAGDQIHGLTVSAFASISPDPPLVAIVIDHHHRAFNLLQKPDASFAVNILQQDQVDLSNRFAWIKDQDRFSEGDWGAAITGAPILKDSLTWLDCSIFSCHTAYTHTIYVGLVEASNVTRPDDSPLVYWNRDYRQLKDGCGQAGG